MNRATAIARVCAAHNNLRTSCRITNRTRMKSFGLGVFVGQLAEVENELRITFRESFVHEHDAYSWLETIQRVQAVREAFTRIYIEGWL